MFKPWLRVQQELRTLMGPVLTLKGVHTPPAAENG